MKHLSLSKLIPVFLIFLSLSCVDPLPPACRISKMLWEGQWHRAFYSGTGRLSLLEADSSKVIFYYNLSDQLEKAEIFTTHPDPDYRFEYVHGPLGIIETNEYHPSVFGDYRVRFVFHYSGPGRVDYIIRQEYGADPDPGFEIRYDFTYISGNVRRIDGTSSVITTSYSASRYDKKKNPFRALAVAVGNPTFFPACVMANFPVATYDISYMTLFSINNPVRGQYEIPGVDPYLQTFDNTYGGSIARKIGWSNSSYGTVDTNEYEFDFDCGRLTAEE